jgi:hypothetical protein
MRKGILKQLCTGVAMAAAVASLSSVAQADLDGTDTYTEPAGTLVMPFDVTTNKRSFQLVSRIGNSLGTFDPIATHWSFWADDCRHLADVFICLTPDDTVVVDPTDLQGQVQSPNPPANVPVGPKIDLTGEKGMVTVTAFEADVGSSGLDCRVVDPEATLQNEIAGFWTIANITTNAAFGNDAIGLSSQGGLPDPALLSEGGLKIQTFNPQDLQDSEVIVLGIEFPAGFGQFRESELGPINRPSAVLGGFSVCCDTTFRDNLEIQTSLPAFCFECVGFAPISDNVAEDTDPASIIPPTVTVESSGFIHLENCTSANEDGTLGPVGEGDFEQFLFAYHGQAVGSFGAMVKGKYTGGPF